MRRLLIVEDSPTQAQQLALILGDAGFAVEIRADAERGFDRLLDGGIDAVLTDLLLPGDSGFDLCERIRHHPALTDLVVVVLTGQGDPANVLRGLAAGADGFITKNHEPDEVVARIVRVLDRPAHPRASPDAARTRVDFLGETFEFAASPDQLANVLVSAFEDVVHLNKRLSALAESERHAHDDLKRTEAQLVQAEKLSSLGQMVAGVAHEINNPLAFVSNNLAVLQRDVGALRAILQDYRAADETLATCSPGVFQRVRAEAERIDLDYTLSSLDRLFERSQDGLRRIQQIVRDLREFARLDESDLSEVDLNAGIASTVNIVEGRAHDAGVTLALDLAPLPTVTCYPAKINQVVMNLVANAIDACAPGGHVTVRTRAAPGGGAEVYVEDDGRGIDPAVVGRIFDPFFTTKPQGTGTGLGLSISYGIVQAHGGRIDVDSAPGRGARFVVRLPGRPPTT